MIAFQDALKRLQESDEFKKWKKDFPKSFLTYGFLMVSSDIKDEWQIGYYNPGKDTITAFAVSDTIIQNPESEIFKDDTNVLELDLKKVKVSIEAARETFSKVQQEKYKMHKPVREMIILQNLQAGQIWNITCITSTYRTLNVKIDAETGEVRKDELIELFKVEK